MNSLHIGSEATDAVLTLFSALPVPLSREAIGQVIDAQGWIISVELDGEVIIADGTWGTGGGEIVITFDGETATDVAIGLISCADDTDSSRREAQQVYDDTVELAIARLGQPAGTRVGQEQRTWFTLATGTIMIAAGKNSATLSWWSPEYAAIVMNTYTADEDE